MQTPYFFVKVNRSEKTMELHLVFVDADPLTVFEGAFFNKDDADKHAESLQEPSCGSAYVKTVDIQ
tara:strand:+ start:1178 stop:1375 length:198 start_codon:yes stop_codon:yes gene_type:complete